MDEQRLGFGVSDTGVVQMEEWRTAFGLDCNLNRKAATAVLLLESLQRLTGSGPLMRATGTN